MINSIVDYESIAQKRVDDTPELQPYREIIFYDWIEGNEHIRWVATAPIREILDWCETIESILMEAAE